MVLDRGISVLADMGYEVPKAYLESIMKAKPTVYGCVIKKNEDIPEAFFSHLAKPPQLDVLVKMNEAMVARRLVQWFGQLPADTLTDNIQPFRLLQNSKGHCIVAATLCGDFKHHLDQTKDASKHTPEWWCANSRLLPKLQQIYRLVKEDTAALQSELANNMRTEITELIGNQGGVIKLILFTDTDTVIWDYIKSMPTYKKYPWGNTSDPLDYVTGIVETKPPEKVEAKVEKPKKNKFLAAVETEGEDEKPKEETPAQDPAPSKEDPKAPIIAAPERQIVMADGATIVVTDFKGERKIVMYPNVLLTNRKALRRHYQHYCMRTLSNAELDKRVGVVVKNADVLKEVEKRIVELQSLGVAGSDAPRSKTTQPEVQEKVPVKNTATGQTSEVVVSTPQAQNPLPEGPSVHEDRTHPEGGSYISMTNKQRYDVNKHLKSLSDGGVSLENPHLDQELEDTTEQFFKQIGYSGISQTLGWKYETRLKLAQLAPEAMAIWSGDLLRMIRNLEKDIEGLTDTDVMTDKRKTA